MFDYLNFGKIVKAINFTGRGYDSIVLYFEHKIITFYAYGDCCSVSRFEIPDEDLAPLIGKKITYTFEGTTYDDPHYTDYGRLQITPISIMFDDGTKFDFELHNSSNGYYSGWMEAKEGLPDELPVSMVSIS